MAFFPLSPILIPNEYNDYSTSAKINQFKTEALLSLEAKKKSLLTKELLEKICGNLTEEEFKRFLYLTNKVNYKELKELFDLIIKMRCVQKNCDDL